MTDTWGVGAPPGWDSHGNMGGSPLGIGGTVAVVEGNETEPDAELATAVAETEPDAEIAQAGFA